jgi:hypothetical protein
VVLSVEVGAGSVGSREVVGSGEVVEVVQVVDEARGGGTDACDVGRGEGRVGG